jgi:predicted ATPase
LKIDLHCHTKSVKCGDGTGRNVTPDLFRSKIIDADVKIVAITNHNSFDFEQYKSLCDIIHDICQVWPGVEIDVKDNAKKWHLIVIANPDKVEDFSSRVNLLFVDKNLETCTHTLDEVYEAFNGCDVIYISHFHKKPAVTEEDLEKLLELVGDKSRVFNETPDHRTLGVFANYNFNVMIGSDVKEWKEYEKCTFAELRLPVENFSQFCMLAKRDPVVVETLLNKKQPYELKASPHKSVHFILRIYPDVNILFGQKGTGKTEILKSLHAEMLAQGLVCKKCIASERGNEFDALMSLRDMEADLGKVGASPCSEEFDALSSWTDGNPTQFANYLNWYRTRGNSGNKSRMKITEATDVQYVKPNNYDEHKKDKNDIDAVTKRLRGMNVSEYIGEDLSHNLFEALNVLIQEIQIKRRDDLIAEYSIKLTNASIDNIKRIADRNSDTVSRPSSTGLRDLAQKRIELLRLVNKILDNLSRPEHNERVKLGTLEDKGDIFINRKYRMLCENSRTSEFMEGIRFLQELKERLEYIREHIFENDISYKLSELLDKFEEKSITSTKCFLGRSKQIITDDGAEYTPSNGEKGILLLQQTLNEEADAYFLDEPELGMGNSYIDTNIRPLISALAKRRKCIIIATHNANIAVRTLPYMSIYRVHQNGEYTTYVGNPFNDRLVNIDDESDIKSWTDESLHTLEGSKEAFYESIPVMLNRGL